MNLKTILQSKIFFLLLFFLAFLSVVASYLFPRKSKYSLDTTEIIGKVVSYKIDGNFMSIKCKGKETVMVTYYFTSLEEKENIEPSILYGTTLKINGSMEIPKENTIPNTFSYQKYLNNQNIFYIMKMNSFEVIQKPSFFYALKNKIIEHFSSYEEKDYILAMVFGNMNKIDTSVLKQNGIIHLFSVSGMHISYFIMMLSFLLKRWKHKRIILSIFLFFYLFLVGFTIGVLRAVLVYYFVNLNEYFKWNLNKKRMVEYLFCMFLICNPYYIREIGFLYSFLLSYSFFFLKEEKKHVWGLLKMSVYSFFVSLPITASNFYYVNVLSILWNLFFIPFVTYLLYPSALLSIILPYPFKWLLSIFKICNLWCASITFLNIVIPKVSIFIWILYGVFFYIFIKTRKKRYFIFLILLLSIILVYPKLNSSSYVYFIDVGQGDSTLFISPYQKEVILIDTGGKLEFSKEEWEERSNKTENGSNLITFFYSLGISRITNLVISHGDYDHCGNALYLLQNMKIDSIILNHNKDTTLESNIRESYPKKIKETLTSKFYQIEEYSMVSTNENDSSLVYFIQIFHTSIFMTGDISSNVEQKILQKIKSCDILKIPHHGSKTSSSTSFLKKLNPTVAIISVGENNTYGHPSKRVLEDLNKLSIITYTTMDEKTIKVKLNKNGYRFHFMLE